MHHEFVVEWLLSPPQGQSLVQSMSFAVRSDSFLEAHNSLLLANVSLEL